MSTRQGTTIRALAVAVALASLPAASRAQAEPAAAEVRTIKGRLRDLSYDKRLHRGEVKAEVAGRIQTFHNEDPALFRGLRRGDIVILRVTADGTLVSIETASLTGRITAIGPQRRSITVSIEGREETFAVALAKLLDHVQVGDSIRFDADDSASGPRVLTQIR